MAEEVKDFGLGEREWSSDVEEEIDQKIWEELDKKEEKKDDQDEDDDLESEEEIEEEEESEDVEKESDEDNPEDKQEDNKDKDGDEDAKKEEVDEETVISERAKLLIEKYKIDEGKAKEIAKGDMNLAKNFKNDPLEVAHAMRSLQSEYTRVNEELLSFKRQSANPYTFTDEKVIIIDPQSGKKKELAKAEFVEKYREAEKEDKELEKMSDDEVYREAKRKNQEWLKSSYARAVEEVKVKAKAKRSEIYEKLKSGENKAFADDVKELLEHFGDDLLAGDFDESLPVRLVKGKRYDDDIKKAREEAIATGKKNAQIKDKKASSPASQGKTASGSKSYSDQLTRRQRQEALEMFDGDKISDEEKFKLYFELEKGEKK